MLARTIALPLCCFVGVVACGSGEELFGPPAAGGFGGGMSAGGGQTTSTTTSTTTSDTTSATTSDTTSTTTSDTTSTTTWTTTTSTSTTSGTGGEGGSPLCGPPMHLCGSACVGNTPATGCYLSWSCQSCPAVAHATASCSGAGECTYSCLPPYVPSAGECVCPTQCCEPDDCLAPAVCSDDGQCVGGCDLATCLFNCIIQGYSNGTCNAQGACVCT